MSRERTSSGTFAERVSPEDVIGLFDRVDGPVITSSDVAEAFDVTTEAARQKLRRLADRGELGSRKSGRTVLYWLADEDGQERVTDRDTTDTLRDASTPSDRDVDDLIEERYGNDRPDDLPEGLSGVDWPSTKDRRECEEAVLAARDYIKEHGEATMREIVNAVMPDYPVGYTADLPLEEGERFRGAWWRRVVAPGLEVLESIEKPPRGGSTWEYVGEKGEEVAGAGGVYDPTEEF